jgi:hypothetical protein
MSGQTPGATTAGGCVALIAIVIAVALIAMAVISLAATFDPFNWMPTAHQIWDDCEGDCALAHRFPGFWWHAAGNLLYGAITLTATFIFGSSVVELRNARGGRYESAAADAAFRQAHGNFLAAGSTLGGLALLPIAVALA